MSRKAFNLLRRRLSSKQREELRSVWDVVEVMEMPDGVRKRWTTVPPGTVAVRRYIRPVVKWLEDSARPDDVVVVEGDFGAVFHVVKRCLQRGLLPVYPTFQRVLRETTLPDGSVFTKRIFEHVRFRVYEPPIDGPSEYGGTKKDAAHPALTPDDLYIENEPSRLRPFTLMVDSHLPDAPWTWDHHLSGERTNVDLIIDRGLAVPRECRHIAATHIDTDSVLSAAALLFGLERMSDAQKETLRAAAEWGDHFLCSRRGRACREGLSLHFHLKKVGRELRERLRDEQGRLSGETLSEIYRILVDEVLCMLESGAFRPTEGYREVLEEMKRKAKGCISYQSPLVTAFSVSDYLDPMAAYALHDSLLQVIHNERSNRFDIGVHPKRAGENIDLGPLMRRIQEAERRRRREHGLPDEPTWGGRKTAFGSPRRPPGERSSVLSLDDVVKIIEDQFKVRASP